MPRDPLIYHNLAVVYLSRAQEEVRRGDSEGARADWGRARDNAALCVRYAPNDPLGEIRDQVDRMGRRWGFTR